jgi:hypothetical protein
MLEDDDVQFWKYDRCQVTSSRFPQIFQKIWTHLSNSRPQNGYMYQVPWRGRSFEGPVDLTVIWRFCSVQVTDTHLVCKEATAVIMVKTWGATVHNLVTWATRCV